MKLKRAEDPEVSIDMSPMIDMVFLLLIFFIVASAMVDLDKPMVNLPTASAAKVADDVSGRLNVSVSADEQFFIGAAPVTLDELKTRVAAELDLNPNLRIFIRSDAEVPYRVNKKLMTACADVGAVNLIYAAFED
jgi:biopolymer transport protein ExbD